MGEDNDNEFKPAGMASKAGSGTPPASAPYRWPLAVVAIALIFLFAFLAFLWSARRAYETTLTVGGQAGRAIAEEAKAIAAKFASGTITRTFVAAIPEITSAGAGRLELATARQVETFRAEDSLSVFWDKLYLGTTLSEIRVPVTYRYHLELSDPWRLDVSGQTCLVIAPPIRPSLPPAIHTDQMEKRSEAGWARFNAQQQLDNLEKGITPTLTQYARDRRHLALAREQCRQTVAEFVRTWLLKEDQWRTDRFRTIKVVFADEQLADPARQPPTLRLE
jgi:hypothetical protein